MKDLYEVLGVDKTATAEEIQKAYRKMAHKSHPDKEGGSEEMFYLVAIAGEVLRDHAKRTEYDETGSYDQGVEDDAIRAEQMVVDAFFSIYSTLNVTEIEYTDLVSLAVGYLMNKRSDNENNIELWKKNKVAQEKVIERLTLKDKAKGKGLVLEAFRGNIRNLGNDVANGQKMIEQIDEAVQLATEYEYKIEDKTEELGLGTHARQHFEGIGRTNMRGGGWPFNSG